MEASTWGFLMVSAEVRLIFPEEMRQSRYEAEMTERSHPMFDIF